MFRSCGFQRGIETDSKTMEIIKNLPIPKAVTDIQSFLKFTNYYRRFIPKYNQVA